ncbi:unnamed protein product [Arabis nemorensis]|uniref:Prolyl 4-hydroxylase alpha subunit domain-containing protein n=1 Tax=Arabis nemorensis TaxID=586526 RepID=A0A565BI68_9BRAS|nr:unnamed protein product [Arabis nemorensis]
MSIDRREEMTVDGDGSVGGGDTPLPDFTPAETVSQSLRRIPNNEHKPESYEDLELEFSPCLFSSLEKYLPLNMLSSNRDEKVKFMSSILLKYLPRGERSRVRRHKEYKQNIISNYQRLNKELYTLDPTFFFLPSFLKAIDENTEESFRSIISEPFPGVYVFKMLQPDFCEMMLSEVENFGKWVNETKLRIIRPNTMTNYGAVLDDFGLDSMLDQLIEGFILPLSKGKSIYDFNALERFVTLLGLSEHHSLEKARVNIRFSIKVTLNACLGKEFLGGELYFRGTRCEKHVNTDAKPEETFDYSHIPGQAILHRGRHRHGARATISGHRVNMILWCRSSIFREMKTYQKGFPNWCGECSREKKETQMQTLAAKRKELIRIESKARDQ